MNRLLKTLIPAFLLVLVVSGCSNASQNEAEYFDPMDAYIAELREMDFSPTRISSESLDTTDHSSMVKSLNALTPPRLYSNTHQTLIDQIGVWTSNSSKASAHIKVAKPEIVKLVNTLNLSIDGEISCETVRYLNSLSAEQQSSDLSNFINSSTGADTILFCESLFEAEHKILRAFDRYNELKTDRKAVVDDLVSTQ